MYSVKLGYDAARERIKNLAKSGYHAESLVTSVFTAEKTLRRTLKQLIVSSGFKSSISNKIIKKLGGIYPVCNAWELYDPEHRKIETVVSNDAIRIIKEAAQKRNKMIHGEKVFKPEVCKAETKKVLKALKEVKDSFDKEYGYSGWTKVSIRRKSLLHLNSKVDKR